MLTTPTTTVGTWFTYRIEVNPISGNIVYKIDLGEKYIVKKPALEIRGTNNISYLKNVK